MSYTFNPFTGNFDDIGSGGGGGGGDITAVTAGTGLSGGGTSGDVTLSLANTAVTPASYTYASITVDAQGRITSASSGTTPVTAAAGTNSQIQFNDSGPFAGDSGLTFNKTTNLLTVGASTADGGQAKVFGDINLDDGGSFTTTIQCVTPLANRTISFPDATGTVALVAGSSGQLLWNNAGANAGASTLTYDGSILTTSGRFINSYNSGSLAPAKAFTGTWATGAGTTNTKPHVLIETTGATSNNWSNSGTGLGVNAASGFAGNLLDLQVNGTRQVSLSNSGNYASTGSVSAGSSVSAGNGVLASTGVSGTFAGVLNSPSSYHTYLFAESPNTTYATALTKIVARFALVAGPGEFALGSGGSIGFTSGALASTNIDASISRHSPGFINANVAFGGAALVTADAANTLAQRNGTSAQTFRCYGTYTDASNYVRAALSSSSTAVTLAAETAGTGADNIPINLTAAGTGTVKVNSVAEVAVSSTVAGLPTAPAVGMLTRVTDATAPAVGSTVAGGGAAAALVWYNGTNWTVIGV